MVALIDLWLPILLSAVFVFIASSIIHMVIPIHQSDYQKLSAEDDFREAMRGQGVQPGEYVFPCPASVKDMSSPEHLEKLKQGPVGFLTVIPSGPPAMGKSLLQWFLFSILIGAFAGYVGTFSLVPGDGFMDVLRVTGTVAILGYGVSQIPHSIWKGMSWGVTCKYVFDGIVYGLGTAAAFAWLWPSAA